MDVFKLLSKSSKRTSAPPSQKLPSSGAIANPQLFGHDDKDQRDEVRTKSLKRKRGRATTESSSSLPAEIDFFGDASHAKTKGRKGSKKASRNAVLRDNNEASLENSDSWQVVDLEKGSEDVDEEECKRIFRSHKCKMVVLEDFGRESEHLRRKRKNKRGEKSEVSSNAKTKKEKVPLYPQPLTSFVQLRTRYAIDRRVAQNIKEQGYKLPTEVQMGALPMLLGSKVPDSVNSELLHGRRVDLLTVAPTGSGKTMAFLIPMIDELSSVCRNHGRITDTPRALVIAPTKELAYQIVNEARKLVKGTAVKVSLMKKGMEVVERSNLEHIGQDSNASSQDEEESGPDSDVIRPTVAAKKDMQKRAERVKAALLVATPLALLNALKDHNGRILDLPTVHTLVLDEADVLLDPLFREQTLSIWNACTNPELGVSLWSATMGSNIEDLTLQTLNTRWENVSSSFDAEDDELPKRPPLVRLIVGLKDTALPNITHKLIYAATEAGKLLGLRQLLHPTAAPANSTEPSLRPPFLVFTQTIPRAKALHAELLYDIPPSAGGSTRLAVLHADLSSSAREAIMTRFRRGEIWVLITTDLLSRGVDFRGLNGVVNYDVPSSAAAYVHRVGRTGRAGREGGVAVTFYTQEDVPFVKGVANVIRASEKLRGIGEEESSVKQWLLEALPTPGKRVKERLKRRGVESRRQGGKGARISTKSGYERRADDKKRGAKIGSMRRNQIKTQDRKRDEDGNGSEFEGFDD
jgi:ATP-dependent RNA helicase DDX52/ROK1